MVVYLPRSAWTSTDRGGSTLTGGQLEGCSVHYPASGNVTLAGLSREQVASRLRGWRDYHVNTRGWSDIGYQKAIDGSGRVWDLRGIHRVPAASASASNPDANREWGACLIVVGNNEQPTQAAIHAFQHWRTTRWLKQWPRATRISGHGQVPGAQTECPGPKLRALIADGTLAKPPEDDAMTDEQMDKLLEEIDDLKDLLARPLGTTDTTPRQAWQRAERRAGIVLDLVKAMQPLLEAAAEGRTLSAEEIQAIFDQINLVAAADVAALLEVESTITVTDD